MRESTSLEPERGESSLLLACIDPSQEVGSEVLLERIRTHRFPELGSVTLGDLARLGAWPHGVYLLHDEAGKVWYVGKATSRSFTERLPAHFDPRPDAWFNTIPKRIFDRGLAESYAEALEFGLSLRIALIGISDASSAARLETELRTSLTPMLNTRSAPRPRQGKP